MDNSQYAQSGSIEIAQTQIPPLSCPNRVQDAIRRKVSGAEQVSTDIPSKDAM